METSCSRCGTVSSRPYLSRCEVKDCEGQIVYRDPGKDAKITMESGLNTPNPVTSYLDMLSFNPCDMEEFTYTSTPSWVTLKEQSDGSTASYYELPGDAEQLQDLISHKNMNAQVGEIFRECYRYGQAEHCDQLRGINKILFYAEAEKKRLEKVSR